MLKAEIPSEVENLEFILEELAPAKHNFNPSTAKERFSDELSQSDLVTSMAETPIPQLKKLYQKLAHPGKFVCSGYLWAIDNLNIASQKLREHLELHIEKDGNEATPSGDENTETKHSLDQANQYTDTSQNPEGSSNHFPPIPYLISFVFSLVGGISGADFSFL